jgi:beta-lactamase regulating signal transducer with metallopeptidase domain
METISGNVLTFLLNAAWQIAAVTGVTAAASYAMRYCPARYRHAMWAAALIAAVVLPLASVARPHTPTASLQVSIPDLATSSPAVTDAAPDGRSPTPAPVRFTATAGTIVTGLYLLTLLYGYARFGFAWSRTLRIRGGAEAITPSFPLDRVWKSAGDAFGVRRVALLSSPSVTGPVALGAFRRAIIVPNRFRTEGSEQVLTAAIGHEMAHVARNDFAANLCYELLYVLISFHPASWFIRRQIERTREVACDEAVTARLLEPRVYARSIMYIATCATTEPQPGYTLGIFDGSMLEERMRRLLRGSSTSVTRSRLLFAAAVAALVIAAVTASGLALTARAQAGYQELIKQGVSAYNAGDFAAAAGHFTTAVSLDSANVSARLFLANTLLRDFYTQQGQPDSRLLTAAEQQYGEVLARDPDNKQALAGMSTIAVDRKQFRKAREWTEKLAAADPNDKTAWYTLGLLDWAMVFPEFQRVRQAAGARAEDYAIPDANLRRTFRDAYAGQVDEGIRMLRKALELDAGYHEAIAYLNLHYRIKAGMADDSSEAASLIAQADKLIGQAVQAKQKAAARPAESSLKLDAEGPAPGPPGKSTMVKAQPPPPPPPPGPERAKQIASASPQPRAEPGQPPIFGMFWQVVGSTDTPAIDLFRQLQKRGFDARLHAGSDNLVRVVAGPYFDRALLEKAKKELEAAGFRPLRIWE